MAIDEDNLEFQFATCDYGLSARRLWEFTELGQINVFGRAISQRAELNDPAAYIDVVRYDQGSPTFVGCTLAALRAGTGLTENDIRKTIRNRVLMEGNATPDIGDFEQEVRAHLDRCALRQALRNHYQPFLSPPKPDDVFGVPHIFSSLQRRLRGMGNAKAGGEQWLKTVENLQASGLRNEEYWESFVRFELEYLVEEQREITATELADLCDFTGLRLSVIPLVSDAKQQIRFVDPPDRKLSRTKKLPKAQAGQSRDVARFDPVLGYRIEQLEHQTLWGPEIHWQAVRHDGAVIHDAFGQTLFPTQGAAAEVAGRDAKQNFPKRVALGQFGHWAWTGGKDYREWLITLPFYSRSYLSGHFRLRNVLAHVRCDVREGADGEQVLMLQEVQSDWAQRARRAASTGQQRASDEVEPPFKKEWLALAMKLVFLHAAQNQLDAVAWTRGEHQVLRYNGLGAKGLNELYDRMLPREVNRMLKPFGTRCEALGVFVPTNFGIRQTELGYDVYSPMGELLGTAPTLEEAREFVPDLGHERLYDVHGVRLTDLMRKAILDSGFPAWG